MPQPILVESPQDVRALLDLDRPDNCLLCDPESMARAKDVIEALCRWWLSETQRSLWHVPTVVEGRPTRASFKIACDGRPNRLPVFLVMCQHGERKKLPHYQLQVPHGSLGEGINDAAIRERVEALVTACDRETERFREPDAKSIALHSERSLSDWMAVLESITRLVVGLRSITQGTPKTDSVSGRVLGDDDAS